MVRFSKGDILQLAKGIVNIFKQNSGYYKTKFYDIESDAIDLQELVEFADNDEIFTHIKNGDLDKIDLSEIDKIASLKTKIFSFDVPMIAAYYGRIKILYALKNAINFNYKSLGGFTMLSMAADRGHFNIVRWLVNDMKVNPNLTDNYGVNALMRAAINGHLDIIKWLLLNKHFKINLNASSKYERTALFLAARHGHLHILQWFFEKRNELKINFTAYDICGYDIYFIAAVRGHFEIVKYIFANKKALNIDLNAVKKSGLNVFNNVLDLALISGNWDLVEWLSLKENFKKNFDIHSNSLSLLMAALGNYLVVKNLLLKKYASIDKLDSNNNGILDLSLLKLLENEHDAVDEHYQIVQFILNTYSGVSINHQQLYNGIIDNLKYNILARRVAALKIMLKHKKVKEIIKKIITDEYFLGSNSFFKRANNTNDYDIVRIVVERYLENNIPLPLEPIYCNEFINISNNMNEQIQNLKQRNSNLRCKINFLNFKGMYSDKVLWVENKNYVTFKAAAKNIPDAISKLILQLAERDYEKKQLAVFWNMQKVKKFCEQNSNDKSNKGKTKYAPVC